MEPADYYTAFDVTTAGFRNWRFPAFGLIFIAVGLLLPVFFRIGIFRKGYLSMEKWFPRLFLGFAILWTLVISAWTFGDDQLAVAAIQNHQAEVVEGMVTNFQPMPVSGHAMESFKVDGVKFEYSDFVVAAGFDNAASHGGPLREGSDVRIWHDGGSILRLDIQKTPTEAAASPAGSSHR